jgi:hypothetical protein
MSNNRVSVVQIEGSWDTDGGPPMFYATVDGTRLPANPDRPRSAFTNLADAQHYALRHATHGYAWAGVSWHETVTGDDVTLVGYVTILDGSDD